jgi:TonB family protein
LPISFLLGLAAAVAPTEPGSVRPWADTGIRTENELPEPAIDARLLNVGSLIATDDYPLEALFRQEEGSVTVRMLAKADGGVGDCVVVQSSGSAALDSQTCRLMWMRARFEPARDRLGKPIPSSFRQRITWRLEGQSSPTPIDAWAYRTEVMYYPSGGISGCETEASGAILPSDGGCDWFRLFGAFYSGYRDQAGFPVRSMIFESRLIAGDAGISEPMKIREGETLMMRQVSRVLIDKEGRVTECRALSVEGPTQPPGGLCSSLVRERYVAPPAEPGQPPGKVVTITSAIYVTKRRPS